VNITAKDRQRQFPPGKKYPYASQWIRVNNMFSK
jgi:hypothetical protein